MPKIEIPEELLCPITYEIFRHPVVAEDGHTYENEAIKKWVNEKGTSPKTRQKVSNKFIPNLDKKTQVLKFLEENKICTNETFLNAIIAGNTNQIENFNFLDNHLENNNNPMKWTPLHYAASNGHRKITKTLVNLGATTEARSYNGWTPLHVAIEHKDIEMVSLLLSLGAAIEAKTDLGETPLHIAVKHDQVQIVELLLQTKAAIEAQTKLGQTSLCLAIEQGSEEIIRKLLEKGANYKMLPFIKMENSNNISLSLVCSLLNEVKKMQETIEQQQRKIDGLEQQLNIIFSRLELNDFIKPSPNYSPQLFKPE